jgi:hypothetical protein
MSAVALAIALRPVSLHKPRCSYNIHNLIDNIKFLQPQFLLKIHIFKYPQLLH